MRSRARRPRLDIDPEEVRHLREYTGREKYIDWIEDYLNVRLTEPQRDIIYAIMDNQKVLIVAGNGFGKSYVLACFSLAFLFSNYPASVLATSGTYQKLRRTYAKPIEGLHQRTLLPGRYLQHPPRIVIDDDPEVFWEAQSPRDPGELEGVHNEYTLGIVEEADKEAVSHETFESMESLLTDENDKLVAVANPPRNEGNVVYDLMDDSGWTLKQYSSFESHNVKVELEHEDPYVRDEDGEIRTDEFGSRMLIDEVEERMLPELVRLSQIKNDWENWNAVPWPGVEEARNSHTREDLDVRWYRRRMGVLSPAAADVPRPFTVDDVESAFESEPAQTSITPKGMGWDVVRGGGTAGDHNAYIGVFSRDVRVFEYWRGEADHIENYERIRKHLEPAWDCPFAIDAVGVGSEAPDRVGEFYPNVVRFNAGSAAAEPRKYANRWTEGLVRLGQFLRDGGAYRDPRLREELLTAARVIELEERYSRKHDTDRFHASPKSDIKDRLGRSPDLLDAAYMAVLMAETGRGDRRSIPSSF